MYDKKKRKQIKIPIIPIIIFFIIIALIVQAVLSYNNISMKSIIAGRNIAKNEITTTIDQFNWEQDVDSNIGSITIEDNGKTVHMTGNFSDPGKNAIYIIPEVHQEQILSFDYNIQFGDSFNAAGVLLRILKDDNTLKGYMLSFNNPFAADRK